MNELPDKYLTTTYPLLYADRCASMRATCMCWGFECGDGWFKVINDLSKKLEPIIRQYIKLHPYKPHFPRWVWRWHGDWWSLRLYSFISLFRWIMEKIELLTPDPWWPRAVQVKEKFGVLRFYMTVTTPEMDKLIGEACLQSAITCEECGAKAKLRGADWVYTLCIKCWKARKLRMRAVAEEQGPSGKGSIHGD